MARAANTGRARGQAYLSKAADARPILPGNAVGVLGSGQLGRMFAMAARRMGYRVHTLSPDEDTPTGQVADVEVNAPYEDLDAISQFARGVSVVTFEFENVPAKRLRRQHAGPRFVPAAISCTLRSIACAKRRFCRTLVSRLLTFDASQVCVS